MALYDLDPVLSGFEQPSTMTPAGQLRAYQGTRSSYVPPVGTGIMAGAGVVGGARTPISPQQPPGIFPAIPAALGAAGIAIPAWLTALLAVGAAGYAGYQALGGGEGEGLFGINLLGGPGGTIPGTQIELGGPGLPEPGPGTGWMLLKEWHVNYDWGRLQYYLIQKIGSVGKNTNRWIALYNTSTKAWKAWRWVPPKLAVIGKNMPRHQMLTRLRRNLKRHTADATTVLKIIAPSRLETHRRHGGRWVPGKARYID